MSGSVLTGPGTNSRVVDDVSPEDFVFSFFFLLGVADAPPAAAAAAAEEDDEEGALKSRDDDVDEDEDEDEDPLAACSCFFALTKRLYPIIPKNATMRAKKPMSSIEAMVEESALGGGGVYGMKVGECVPN